MRVEKELMRGAGPMAVMQLLSSGEKYGYELVEALSKRSGGVLAMGQSTLYPLLYNLEAKETRRLTVWTIRGRGSDGITDSPAWEHDDWHMTARTGRRCWRRCRGWDLAASRRREARHDNKNSRVRVRRIMNYPDSVCHDGCVVGLAQPSTQRLRRVYCRKRHR